LIERVKTIAPAITRTRSLTVEELKSLNLPLKFQGEIVIIERSLSDWKLREPLAIDLKKILDAKEKGLVDYIVRSCLNERPNIIQYIFDNQTLVKLARHFLRHCSGSHKSCLIYSVNVKKYAAWLGYSPDLIIQDLKPIGAIPDSLKVQNHCGFLNEYLAELQDSGLKPTAISNCVKAVKTFYKVNGAKVELEEKLARKITYKDRAPKPEEIALMLDKSAVREAFIVAAISTGGFREETFSKLKYRHVREDLEANRFPIHVRVEAAITKGKYHDYDTFINTEASKLLKIYIEGRKKGTIKTLPEVLTDDSPLIRNSRNGKKVLGVSAITIRKEVHAIAVQTGVSKKLAEGWMYDVRTHSLRKFFRTQMSAAKIDDEIKEYMLGHTISTYEDVQSLGIETLRNLYTSAGIAIRPKTATNRIEQLREIIRGWGENPEEILSKDALIRGNQTVTEDQQIKVLASELKNLVMREMLE
jgi:site-specific recombinase XerD